MTTETPRMVADCTPWCLAHVDSITHSVEWPCLSDTSETELSQHHRMDAEGVGREQVTVHLRHDHATDTTTAHLTTPPGRDLTLSLDEARQVHDALSSLLGIEP